MAGMLRSCPHHDRICQHGMDCPYSCATGEYRGEKVLVRRTADDSPPADGAFGRRDGLAYQDPLNPCFPSPPSQPGGEAETAHEHMRALALSLFRQNTMRSDVELSIIIADAVSAEYATLLAQRDALERDAGADADEISFLNAKLTVTTARAEASEQALADLRKKLSDSFCSQHPQPAAGLSDDGQAASRSVPASGDR